MLRPLLRWMTTTFALISGAVLLIHSQPFDDGGMRDLLFAPHFPVPCFLSILPGVTTVEAAEAQLEAQGLITGWIERPQDTISTDEVGAGLLRWQWSHARPDILTATQGSLVYNLRSRKVITFGRMETHLPLWVFLVTLGEPTVGFMSGGYNDRDRPVFTHVASYPTWRFNLVSYVSCPMTLRQLWDSQVSIEISNTIGENSRFTLYPNRVKPIMQRAASYFC